MIILHLYRRKITTNQLPPGPDMLLGPLDCTPRNGHCRTSAVHKAGKQCLHPITCVIHTHLPCSFEPHTLLLPLLVPVEAQVRKKSKTYNDGECGTRS